jgi:hypothetical protein
MFARSAIGFGTQARCRLQPIIAERGEQLGIERLLRLRTKTF